jgi:MFS family permease
VLPGWRVPSGLEKDARAAAYLSVSELFPLEARAMAISLFYAFGTGLAAFSPTLFGALIQSASRTNVNYGYLIGAGLMLAAGIIAIFLAVPAERRALEDIASPYQPFGGEAPPRLPLLRGRASAPMVAFLAGRFEAVESVPTRPVSPAECR